MGLPGLKLTNGSLFRVGYLVSNRRKREVCSCIFQSKWEARTSNQSSIIPSSLFALFIQYMRVLGKNVLFAQAFCGYLLLNVIKGEYDESKNFRCQLLMHIDNVRRRVIFPYFSG